MHSSSPECHDSHRTPSEHADRDPAGAGRHACAHGLACVFGLQPVTEVRLYGRLGVRAGLGDRLIRRGAGGPTSCQCEPMLHRRVGATFERLNAATRPAADLTGASVEARRPARRATHLLFPQQDEAVETAVLRSVRSSGIPYYLTERQIRELVGYTETFDADTPSPAALWSMVSVRLAGVAGREADGPPVGRHRVTRPSNRGHPVLLAHIVVRLQGLVQHQLELAGSCGVEVVLHAVDGDADAFKLVVAGEFAVHVTLGPPRQRVGGFVGLTGRAFAVWLAGLGASHPRGSFSSVWDAIIP